VVAGISVDIPDSSRWS